MCGIFGVITSAENNYSIRFLGKLISDLAKFSESRGKEASGIAIRNAPKEEIFVLKGPVPATKFLHSDEYKNYFKCLEEQNSYSFPFLIIGHSRLVTNGNQLDDNNNQPTIKDGIVGIHNGIITNESKIWAENPSLIKNYEIDTEVMLALIRNALKSGENLYTSINSALAKIFGTVSGALLFADLPIFALLTNNGSLYYATDKKSILLFASEKYILDRVLKKNLRNRKDLAAIQLRSNSGLLLDFGSFDIQEFQTEKNYSVEAWHIKKLNFKIRSQSVKAEFTQPLSLVDMSSIALQPEAARERKMLEFNIDRIKSLKRCSKCLLPETFPYIEFDEKGVCNICNNYKPKNQPKPLSVLLDLVEPYRRAGGQPDCIVPFSGGRDSSFSLHYIKKELGLNPIAFTYDWGMVTDLARRNIARVTGKLGVENIIFSADIRKKRDNIRKNVSAWLKNPSLGMVPLFMAGDKSFHYYVIKLKKQTGIDLNIWGANQLENTDFKIGFCGVPLDFNKKTFYKLNIRNQVYLYKYLFKMMMLNPNYLNSSIFDSFWAFASRQYFKKKDIFNFYDYKSWEEKEIEELLLKEYEWEFATDTNTSWRIGDGTAGFYNYIYYTVAGFSEYETFRSNQIREGMISRTEALSFVYRENIPRYDSIKWYLTIIGLDFKKVIDRINSIPKLY